MQSWRRTKGAGTILGGLVFSQEQRVSAEKWARPHPANGYGRYQPRRCVSIARLEENRPPFAPAVATEMDVSNGNRGTSCGSVTCPSALAEAVEAGLEIFSIDTFAASPLPYL